MSHDIDIEEENIRTVNNAPRRKFSSSKIFIISCLISILSIVSVELSRMNYMDCKHVETEISKFNADISTFLRNPLLLSENNSVELIK